MSRPDAERWLKAAHKEISGIVAQHVFEQQELPRGARRVGSMWVFCMQMKPYGSIAHYKARLVANGFIQRPGINCREVWAPTGKLSTLQALLAFAVAKGHSVNLPDITKAFWNGKQEEEIFLAQPTGFHDRSGRVWRLRKALYGFKQAAHAWNIKLCAALKRLGYHGHPPHADPSLFVRVDRAGVRRFIFTHVDDLISIALGLLGKDDLRQLLRIFAGNEVGLESHVLGMILEVDPDKKTICLSQPRSIVQVLERFGLLEGTHRGSSLSGKPLLLDTSLAPLSVDEMQSYAAMVGCLQYLACVSYPYLTFAASQLACHIAKPTQEHLKQSGHCVILPALGTTS
jgi:hypothetical protein